MFGGVVGERLRTNLNGWLWQALDANPGMLEAFYMREHEDVTDKAGEISKVMWYGEFAGKYLQSAVLAWRIDPKEETRGICERVVRGLAGAQGGDGYLGVWNRKLRLTGFEDALSGEKYQHWDVWGHYHCMLGLLMWYDAAGSEEALAVCRRAADFLYGSFPGQGRGVLTCGWSEMNLAVSHVLALLYQRTKEEKYLEFALRIVDEWPKDGAGDYLESALRGTPFWQTPKPRWESLHCIQTMTELYRITGEEKYKRALVAIVDSIRATDRHNTGGFTSGEQAKGSPYLFEPIETCCSVAWSVLLTDALALTGNSRYADEIELTYFNAILGGQHPSGRWWTYSTPMSGVKKASAHDIVFQARQGSPELNCCSVNGPRGLAHLIEWAMTTDERAVTLNYYGESVLQTIAPSGSKVELIQHTEYPFAGKVRIRLCMESEERFKLKLRIPGWSKDTRLSVNGKDCSAQAGTYAELDRLWKNDDEIMLELDMRLHGWVGEDDAAGRVSLYFGPVLLAYDQRCNQTPPEELTELTSLDIERMEVSWQREPVPRLLCRAHTAGGDAVLCDFMTAGMAGTRYQTFLPIMKSLEKDVFQYFHPKLV